jgi:sulfur transfer protein SufE
MILKTTWECREPNVIPVILTELLAFKYLSDSRSGGLPKVYKAIKRYATTKKADDANE